MNIFPLPVEIENMIQDFHCYLPADQRAVIASKPFLADIKNLDRAVENGNIVGIPIIYGDPIPTSVMIWVGGSLFTFVPIQIDGNFTGELEWFDVRESGRTSTAKPLSEMEVRYGHHYLRSTLDWIAFKRTQAKKRKLESNERKAKAKRRRLNSVFPVELPVDLEHLIYGFRGSTLIRIADEFKSLEFTATAQIDPHCQIHPYYSSNVAFVRYPNGRCLNAYRTLDQDYAEGKHNGELLHIDWNANKEYFHPNVTYTLPDFDEDVNQQMVLRGGHYYYNYEVDPMDL